jgi:hypothetical protein
MLAAGEWGGGGWSQKVDKLKKVGFSRYIPCTLYTVLVDKKNADIIF